MSEKTPEYISSLNIIYTDREVKSFLSSVLASISIVAARERRSLTELFKDRLGEQDRCVQGHRRYWEWKFSTPVPFRALVSNISGVSIEIDKDATVEELKESLKKLVDKLDIDKEVEDI